MDVVLPRTDNERLRHPPAERRRQVETMDAASAVEVVRGTEVVRNADGLALSTSELRVIPRRRKEWLNRAVNFSIAVALFLLIRWGASIIVAEISHAHGPAA